MTERRLKLVLAYDGSAYHGFQRQKNAVTVQQLLEEMLEKLCGGPVTTAGSGRTDAGVHALAQTVSFSTEGSIPCANIVRAARKMLPRDIVLISAEEAEADFHARYSARWKRYLYRVLENACDSPFASRYAWQLRGPLDEAAMNEAAACLLGTHDFSAFRSSGSVEGSAVKTVYEAAWERLDGGELRFRIAGDGFLYHMVRNIVWALVQIGLGERDAGSMAQELASKRCEFLNSPAPAQGLYLEKVAYEEYKAADARSRSQSVKFLQFL